MVHTENSLLLVFHAQVFQANVNLIIMLEFWRMYHLIIKYFLINLSIFKQIDQGGNNTNSGCPQRYKHNFNKSTIMQ